jgi:protein-disulfide isomerase-like protein with CxxC motif
VNAVSGLEDRAFSIVISNSVAKLSQKGLSGRRIAAELDILAGPVFAILRRTTSDSIQTMRSTDKNDQLLAVILSARNF